MDSDIPYVIIATGICGTGKTSALRQFCKRNRVCRLDKDSINQSTMIVNPTSQGHLLSIDEYLRVLLENNQARPFMFYNGITMLKMPFPSGSLNETHLGETYERHFKYQVYLNFAKIAIDNLEAGVSSALECLPNTRVKDGTLAAMISGANPIIDLRIDRYINNELMFPELTPNFRQYPVVLVHFITDPETLRNRLIERASKDGFAKERSQGIVDPTKTYQDDELFQRHLEVQPLSLRELDLFSHLTLDTSKKSPDELAKEIEAYVSQRIVERDDLLYKLDESGNILGAVNYNIAHPRQESIQGIRHASINCLIFNNHERNKVLLSLRGKNVSRPNLWGDSASGNLVYGDTPLEGIEGEVSEELFNNQSLPKDLRLKRVDSYSKSTRPNDREYSIYFEAIYNGSFNPGPEVADSRFFDINWLRQDINDNPRKYTGTLKLQLEKLF